MQTLIVDFDGTLVDSVGIKESAFSEIFRDYPQHYDEVMRFHKDNAGLSRVIKFEFLIKLLQKNSLLLDTGHELLGELCHRFSSLVKQRVIRADWIIGAKSFIEYFSKTTNLYLMSITPQKELLEIIEKRKMMKYFVEVIGGTCVKDEMVSDLILKKKLDYNEIILVGDTLQDYFAAKNNRIKFIGLSADQRGFPADAILFPDLNKIANHLAFEMEIKT